MDGPPGRGKPELGANVSDMSSHRTIAPMPAIQYAEAPCPQCGAIAADEASYICKLTQDQTGEYNCAGEFNEAGRSIQPTPESLAAMDKWIDENAGQGDLPPV